MAESGPVAVLHGSPAIAALTGPSLVMRILIDEGGPHQCQLVRCLDLSAHWRDQLLQAGHVRLLTLWHGIHHMAFSLRTWSCTQLHVHVAACMSSSAKKEHPIGIYELQSTLCGNINSCTYISSSADVLGRRR